MIAGGTTSIIDFAVQTYGQRVEEGLAAWHEKAAGNCAIDYGFHQIVGDVNEASLEAMIRRALAPPAVPSSTSVH